MRHASLRSSLPAVLCFIFLIFECANAQSAGERPADKKLPDVSRDELQRLRPVVLADLKTVLSRVANEPKPSQKSVEEEFLRCKFTPLKLGTLGRAILVEGEPGHGATNAAMLNIYLPEHGSYRRVLEAAGFGPNATGQAAIPDLVFGWASGVCHAKYYRYTFKSGRYDASGCDQETEPAASAKDDCVIQSCSGEKLPIFPNPWPDESEKPPQSSQQLLVGQSVRGKQIWTAKLR